MQEKNQIKIFFLFHITEEIIDVPKWAKPKMVLYQGLHKMVSLMIFFPLISYPWLAFFYVLLAKILCWSSWKGPRTKQYTNTNVICSSSTFFSHLFLYIGSTFSEDLPLQTVPPVDIRVIPASPNNGGSIFFSYGSLFVITNIYNYDYCNNYNIFRNILSFESRC